MNITVQTSTPVNVTNSINQDSNNKGGFGLLEGLASKPRVIIIPVLLG